MMGSSESKPSVPRQATNLSPTTQNLASDLKPPGDAAKDVKPCCVCKTEKSTRDECMLFASSTDPQKECETQIEGYRRCMRGFGFHTR